MGTLLQDLRYGLRTLWRSPGFTLVAVTVLALGISVNSAIFSVVNGVLLKPLNAHNPERLVFVFENRTQVKDSTSTAAPVNFVAWRERSKSFEAMAAYGGQNLNLTGSGFPEQLSGAVVSANLFSLLPIKPALGRDFLPSEDQPESERVIILGHGLWQRRFNSDPRVIDQKITLNENAYKIIGVMPPGFDFPTNAEFWTPLVISDGAVGGMGGRILSVIARLKPGVTVEQAEAEMNSIAESLAAENPEFNAGWGVTIVQIHALVVRSVRWPLLVLWGVVCLVLLIACANVANLLLTRASHRRREIAIRVAVGASRRRIVRQLLTESVLLALIGGALGLLLAVWGVDALIALGPNSLPRIDEIKIDRWVLGYTLAISLLTGVLFGLVPALQISKPNLNELLKEGIRSSPSSFGRDPVRSLLVVAEVAISLVLLICAGLMIRSFTHLQGVNPGFDPRHVVTMQVNLPETKYGEDRQVVDFYRQAFARIRTVPGVAHVGATHSLPWSGNSSMRYFYAEGQPLPETGREDSYNTNYRVITPDYFDAMGIPVLKGRDFTEGDTLQSPAVVIVNEMLAARLWPNEDALGKRIRQYRPGQEQAWFSVVGVVGNVRHYWLGDVSQPEIYIPYTQVPLLSSTTIERHRRFMQIAIRTKGDPLAVVGDVRREVAGVDPELPLYNVRTMEERLGVSLMAPRFNTLLMGIFAAVALILAVVGLYGVMSYAVVQRTHEIGIRMALGASRADVLRFILRQGMALVLAGVAVGLVAASLLTRALSTLLYEVSPTDPTTFIGISLILIVVAFFACYIPARRATRVEPLVALRHE
ncbi:MAG TPA: ABC transporter permease [Pyrinomonadaceae bacterium]|nr:ABC transporter permease [Pyrinomonadaceae bacterium]